MRIDSDDTRLFGVGPNVNDAIDIKLRPGAHLGAFARDGVLVFKDAAKDHGWKVGDTVDMTFERTGTQQVPIQGIYDENKAINSDYLLALQSYIGNYTDQTDSLVAVRKASEASNTQTRATIERVLRGTERWSKRI